MSLAIRIIPQLLCRGRQLIKGTQYNSWRSVGVAAQAVRIHQMRGVDELLLLDISATPAGRGPNIDLVHELSEVLFSPISVGGGVKTIGDVGRLLRNGADKIVICSAAYEDPNLITKCADKYGSQAIVVSIDVSDGLVMSHCGTQEINLDPVDTALMWESCGAGELIINSIDREGMMNGYDLDLIKAISEEVAIPVIASGGCGLYQHMEHAVKAGASAVSSGAMFQFTDNTPKGAANYLHECGIEVRL